MNRAAILAAGFGLAFGAAPVRAETLMRDREPTGIATSLTGAPGDAARGRAIVADRTQGLCLLCHSGPIPEERFQGNLAPSLAGAGSRSSEAELRLRLVDSRRLNPDTIMPAYGKVDGFTRVGAAFRDRSILTPADIEDVVAYLMTLKEEPQ